MNVQNRKILFFSKDVSKMFSGDLTTEVQQYVSKKTIINRTFEHENFISLYSSFIFDEETREYRIYYIARDKSDCNRLAFACSKDMINWQKPNLGICEVNGSKSNNLLGIHAADSSVFYDSHDEKSRRYKHLIHIYNKGLFVNTSPDGIHWNDGNERLFSPTFHDGHNMAFWDDNIQKYRLYLRGWSGNPLSRVVLTTECDSLTNGTLVFKGEAKTRPTDEQPYLSADNLSVAITRENFCFKDSDVYTLPVAKYPGGNYYIGFPAIYSHVNFGLENDGIVQSALCTSVDGVNWNCHGGDEKSFYAKTDDGHNMAYMGAGVYAIGDKMYVCGNVYKTRHGEVDRRRREGDGEIVLYTQDIDRFVGASFGENGGKITTERFEFNNSVKLNYKGEIKIDILNFANENVESITVSGNSFSEQINFKHTKKGEVYRLELTAKNSTVFAIYL